MGNVNETYIDNGVVISKKSPKAGDRVNVIYNGLLAVSGADTIIAHVGYGDDWLDREFINMSLADGKWNAEITAIHPGMLNIAFKDGADNWDNNSSNNYSFKIARNTKAAKKETIETPIVKAPAKAAKKETAKKTASAETRSTKKTGTTANKKAKKEDTEKV